MTDPNLVLMKKPPLTLTQKLLIIVILLVTLALPLLAWYAFDMGVRTMAGTCGRRFEAPISDVTNTNSVGI